MRTLETALRRMPAPATPAGMAARIQARIAELDERSAGGDPEISPVTVGEPRRDRLAWAAAFAGMTVGIGAQAYRLIVGEATLQLTAPRLVGVMNGAIEVSPASPGMAVLAAGLLLYLAGLFAPLRSREAR